MLNKEDGPPHPLKEPEFTPNTPAEMTRCAK